MPHSTQITASADEPDEITPLLRPSESSEATKPQQNGHADAETATAEDEEEIPLPMFQIFILCIARVMDPISFFSIFPFVPSMVRDTGVLEEDVGFYTGVIVRASTSFTVPFIFSVLYILLNCFCFKYNSLPV
jgi:hypothetical protein